MSVRPINALKADRENDNRLLNPEECLQDALADLQEGKVKATSALVLFLDTGEEDEMLYSVRYNASNLKASDMLALLEVAKIQVLKSMNYIPGYESD